MCPRLQQRPRRSIRDKNGGAAAGGRLQELQTRLDNLPHSSSFSFLLQTCADLKALPEGRRLHALIFKTGLHGLQLLCHGLITMYGKCGSIERAQFVFANLKSRNVVSWNAIIGAYILNGHGLEGIRMFRAMKIEGIEPNRITLMSVLSACDSPATLNEGKSIHACAIDSGLMEDVAVGSALVSMYGKCEDLDLAKSVFDELGNKDLVAWNCLITAHAQQGRVQEALFVYAQMLSEGMHANRVTFLVALNACVARETLLHGMMLHSSIVEGALEGDVTLGNALINSYGKSEALAEALTVFEKMPDRDVVSWNTLILVCAQNNSHKVALDLFQQMPFYNVKRSEISYVAILAICSGPTDLAAGKSIHSEAINDRLELNAIVGNALLCMYSNCGSAVDVQQMFGKLQVRNIMSWNAIISAYDRHGLSLEAREHFWHMLRDGTMPNEFTFASTVSACANTVALDEGNNIHAFAIECGFESDDVVMSALVNMYGRCGSVDDVWAVFKMMSKRTLITWTAMVSSCAHQGRGQQAIYLFCQMCCEGFEPNEITFVTILSACSHSGLLDESCYYFLSMCQDYKGIPGLIHYCCLVDLFGRLGMLDVAECLVNKMPFQPSYVEWFTLLCACKCRGDVDRGVCVTPKVLELHPEHSAAYVSLSNIYALGSLWELD